MGCTSDGLEIHNRETKGKYFSFELQVALLLSILLLERPHADSLAVGKSFTIAQLVACVFFFLSMRWSTRIVCAALMPVKAAPRERVAGGWIKNRVEREELFNYNTNDIASSTSNFNISLPGTV